MIITLIVIGFIIGTIACFIIDDKFGYRCPDWFCVFVVVLLLFSIISFIVANVCILDAQVNREVEYQNKLYEKEMLEYRIDNMEDNIVGNEMLYNDIVEFNNSLRGAKKWANNPWTSWFFNEDIATIDYIELDYD